MSFKFEKLVVWRMSMDLAEDINCLVKSFPNHERNNLCDQSLRSADSIALNIAEGSFSQSIAERKRFLGFSIRSLAELTTCMYKARRRNYITSSVFEEIYQRSFNLKNMLIAFRKNIR